MSDDLVKRLRQYPDVKLPNEAADRIEKLEAEVERLVKSRNKWGKLYNRTLEKLRLSVMSDSEYVKIIDEKCAEQASRIEKLKAALRLYACDCKPNDGCGIEDYDGGANCGRTAQKALEGKDDTN